MDQNTINKYPSYTCNTKTMRSWFTRAIINNPTNNIWFILRENNIELKVNLNLGLSNRKNPYLRGYEKQFLKKIIKNNI